MNDRSALAGRARVLAGEPRQVVGAGIVLSDDLVLTCYHVAIDSSETSGGSVAAAAAGLAVGGARDDDVIPCEAIWAAPIGAAGDGDLALLRAARPLDEPPARLADCGDAEFDVRIIGHPARSPVPVLARARLVGPVDPLTGWRQLDRLSSATVAIDRGYSGAGVFDAHGRIVGMVVARSQLAQQTVGWMSPVSTWRRLLPDGLIPALAATPRTEPVSTAERSSLARALAAVPTMADPRARAELIQSLPDAIRFRVRAYDRLLLDCRELIAVALDTDSGFAAVYQALLDREGADSISLAGFRALAESMRLTPVHDKED